MTDETMKTEPNPHGEGDDREAARKTTADVPAEAVPAEEDADSGSAIGEDDDAD